MHENTQVSGRPDGPEADGPSTPGGHAVHPRTTERSPADIARHQLAVALTWVRREFPVVPCSRTDKGAMARGFGKHASADELAPFSDPATVEAWWQGRYKRAHVGLLTGRGGPDGRGLVVVDLDTPKADTPLPTGRWEGCAHGLDVLERLAQEAGEPWPETYTVHTPAAGRPVPGVHLYFRQPEDGPLIGCATGDGSTPPHIGPMVDVRGVGGYVIAAGSYSSAQGRPYTRVSPPELLPQPLPAWLLALLRPAARPAPARPPAPVRALPTGTRVERYAAAALQGAADDVAAAVEGTLNTVLFARARRLGELSRTAPHVLIEGEVEAELLAAAVAAGHPEAGARRTIRSGWERGLQDGAGHGAGAA